MAKSIQTTQQTEDATVAIRRRGRGAYRVKFGDVTISGTRPEKEAVEANIERSTKALQRVRKRFTTSGVRLTKKKGVPRYSIDEHDPSVYIRLLDGRIERGHLVDGEFVTLA